MSAYEISPKAAEVIYAALRLYAEHFEIRGTEPPVPCTLQNLLEVFAPPEPPTAAELAEALRRVLHSDPLDPHARGEAHRLLDRYTEWQA